MDAAGIVLALAGGVVLRYDSVQLAADVLISHWYLLPLAVVVRLACYAGLGLYSRLWRHASVAEVVHIVEAGTLGTAILAVTNALVLPAIGLDPISSTSVFVMDWVLNITYVGGTRLSLRFALSRIGRERRLRWEPSSERRDVLIAGAGNAGALVARLIQENPDMGMNLVGYVDDDPRKLNMSLHGSRVIGNRHDIPRLVTQYGIEEVILAMPKVDDAVVDDVMRICAKAEVAMRAIPSIHALMSGEFTVEQLRMWRPRNGKAHAWSGTPAARAAEPFQHLLVAGGAGFIGSNFVRYVLKQHPDCRIIVYDKLTYAGNLDNHKGLAEQYGDRFVFVQGDICDRATVMSVISRYDVDAIVNFAAESHVDRSLLEPAMFVNTNVIGTHTLLEAARQFRVRRFHQVSTDEVYGQTLRGSFSEHDALETRSPYSASKAAADLVVHAYHVSFGLPTTITRGSNSIGPYQYPEKAVALFVTNAIDNEPLPVYGDGLYVRDYQYVEDHCRGIDTVLHCGMPGQVYNLGNSEEVTTLTLAKGILDLLGRPHSLIYFVEDRPGQDRRYSLNCAKVEALGWKAQVGFNDALERTVQWYLDNEWWWRKLKTGEFRKYYELQLRQRIEQGVQLVLSTDVAQAAASGTWDGNGGAAAKKTVADPQKRVSGLQKRVSGSQERVSEPI